MDYQNLINQAMYLQIKHQLERDRPLDQGQSIWYHRHREMFDGPASQPKQGSAKQEMHPELRARLEANNKAMGF